MSPKDESMDWNRFLEGSFATSKLVHGSTIHEAGLRLPLARNAGETSCIVVSPQQLLPNRNQPQLNANPTLNIVPKYISTRAQPRQEELASAVSFLEDHLEDAAALEQQISASLSWHRDPILAALPSCVQWLRVTPAAQNSRSPHSRFAIPVSATFAHNCTGLAPPPPVAWLVPPPTFAQLCLPMSTALHVDHGSIQQDCIMQWQEAPRLLTLEQCWGDLQDMASPGPPPTPPDGGRRAPTDVCSRLASGTSGAAAGMDAASQETTALSAAGCVSDASTDHAPDSTAAPESAREGGEGGGSASCAAQPERVGDVVTLATHARTAHVPSTLPSVSKADVVLSEVHPAHVTASSSTPPSPPRPHSMPAALHPPPAPKPSPHVTTAGSSGSAAPPPAAIQGALASLHSLRRHVTEEAEGGQGGQRGGAKRSPALSSEAAPSKAALDSVASVASSLFGSAARFFGSSPASGGAKGGVGGAQAGRRHSSVDLRSRTVSAPLQPSGSLLSALRWGAATGETGAGANHGPQGGTEGGAPGLKPIGTAGHGGAAVTRRRASTLSPLGEDPLNPFGASPPLKGIKGQPPPVSFDQQQQQKVQPTQPSSPAPVTRRRDASPVVLDNYVPSAPILSPLRSAGGGGGAPAGSVAARDSDHGTLVDSTLAAAAPDVHVVTSAAPPPTAAPMATVAGGGGGQGKVPPSHPREVSTAPAGKRPSHTSEQASGAHSASSNVRPVSGPAMRRLPLPVVAAHVATQLQAVRAFVPVPKWRALAEASACVNAVAVATRCLRQRLQEYLVYRCPWAKVDILSGRRGQYRVLTSGSLGPVQLLPKVAFEVCTEVPSTTGGFMSYTTTREFYKGAAATAASAASPDHGRPRTAKIGYTQDALLGENDTARHELQSSNAAVRCVMQCMLELQHMLLSCPRNDLELRSPHYTQEQQQHTSSTTGTTDSYERCSTPPAGCSTHAENQGGAAPGGDLDQAQVTPVRRAAYADNPFGVPGEYNKASGHQVSAPGVALQVGLPKPAGVVGGSDLASLGSAEWVALSRAGSDGGDSLLGGTPARRSATAVSAISDDMAPPSRYIRPPPSVLRSSGSGGDGDGDEDPDDQATAEPVTPRQAGFPYPMDATAGTLQLHLPPKSYAAAFKGSSSYALAMKMRRAAAGESVFAYDGREDALVFAARAAQLAEEYVSARRLPECDAAWAQWNMAACMLAVNCRWLMLQVCRTCPWYEVGLQGAEQDSLSSRSSQAGSRCDEADDLDLPATPTSAISGDEEGV